MPPDELAKVPLFTVTTAARKRSLAVFEAKLRFRDKPADEANRITLARLYNQVGQYHLALVLGIGSSLRVLRDRHGKSSTTVVTRSPSAPRKGVGSHRPVRALSQAKRVRHNPTSLVN
jgi:hypothetical protein